MRRYLPAFLLVFLFSTAAGAAVDMGRIYPYTVHLVHYYEAHGSGHTCEWLDGAWYRCLHLWEIDGDAPHCPRFSEDVFLWDGDVLYYTNTYQWTWSSNRDIGEWYPPGYNALRNVWAYRTMEPGVVTSASSPLDMYVILNGHDWQCVSETLHYGEEGDALSECRVINDRHCGHTDLWIATGVFEVREWSTYSDAYHGGTHVQVDAIRHDNTTFYASGVDWGEEKHWFWLDPRIDQYIRIRSQGIAHGDGWDSVQWDIRLHHVGCKPGYPCHPHDPGDEGSRACGDCGTQTRTCRYDCTWGGWSSCRSEGPCSPGQAQSRACGDCGTQTRTCGSDCQWGDWGACRGPDPEGGTLVCATGECGPCAEGRIRCVEGWTRCVSAYVPVAELCDNIDNDCNCEVDDGDPEEMGETPPPYAARLQDFSFPRNMEEGQAAAAWAAFENVGIETWEAGDVWLVSLQALEGEPSRLYAEDHWDSWDVPAALDRDIASGETWQSEFIIEAPPDPGAMIAESFRLAGPGGEMMRCPSPELAMEIRTGGEGGQDAGEDDGGTDEEEISPAGGCACGVGAAPAGPEGAGLAFLVLVFLACTGLKQPRAARTE